MKRRAKRQCGGPTHVAITGAGGALGRALACRYAAPGVHLSLSDIDRVALEETARRAQRHGARVDLAEVDVADRRQVDRWLAVAPPPDLVFANAGVSPGTRPGDIAEAQDAATDMVQTNLVGVMNTAYAAIERMAAAGGGHLVLVSSLSALNGFPRVPVYAATKAGVRVFGESLRFGLRDRNIDLLLVLPGFFRSGMTATDDAKAPGGLTADAVAQHIQRGVRRRKARLYIPYRLRMASGVLAALPPAVGYALYKKLFAR